MTSAIKTTSLWLLCFLTVLVVQITSGGYSADCGNHPDEAGHFVSALAIADYIKSGFQSPMFFMKDYYAHFPKVAIGHWPPVFESFMAFAFLLFGVSFKLAILIQAIIAATCLFVPAAALSKAYSYWVGILAAALVLFSPLYIPMLDLVMADTLVAFLILCTALVWHQFYIKRTWRSAGLFCLFAILAILTKGTAFCLILLPPIYLAVKRNLLFLFDKKTIVSAAVIAAVCIPWYALTYKMAADGFVYHWGWSYTSLAIPFFTSALLKWLGVPLVLAFLLGLFYWLKDEARHNSTINFDPAPFATAALSVIIFACLAPADLEKRYLTPALAPIACLAVWSIIRLTTARPIIYRLLACALLVLSFATVFKWPSTLSFHSEETVSVIISSNTPNPLILVSGSVPAEGSIVSAFAIADRERHFYVIRAQKALAQTDWMNINYSLRFSSDDELAAWIVRNKIGWILIDHDDRSKDFQHNVMLQRVLDQGLIKAEVTKTAEHKNGHSVLYRLPAANEAASLSPELVAVVTPGHLEEDKK